MMIGQGVLINNFSNQTKNMSKGSKTASVKAGKGVDYDGDGKVECGSKEHAGVVHNAIQKKKGGKADGQDTRKEDVEIDEGIGRAIKKGVRIAKRVVKDAGPYDPGG